jgi:hypothetical protein
MSPVDTDRLIFGGLLGLSVAGVLQLLQAPPTLALTIAAHAFAVAVPLLTASFIDATNRARQQTAQPPSIIRTLVGVVSALAAVVGLASCFFHFGLVPGFVFIAGVFLAFLLVHAGRS